MGVVRGSLLVGGAPLFAGLLVGVAACRGKAVPSGADAEAGAGLDASQSLPETVVVFLEAGVEPDGRQSRVSGASQGVTVMSGLPRPCEDRQLGKLTFSQVDDRVVITSQKTKVSASCVRMDEHKLLCDWVGKDGKPTVQRKPVSYGPRTKITGSYDKTHTFSCPAQP